jgi:hypothetical protein
MSELGPGCVKLPRNLRVDFHLDFVDVETNCTGSFCRKKAIEKTMLGILGSCTFSHSLGQKPHLRKVQFWRKADIWQNIVVG